MQTKTMRATDWRLVGTPNVNRWRALRLAAALLLPSLLGTVATGRELDGSYTDSTTINAVVRSIPMVDKSMGYKSLADRLPNLGLAVQRLNVGKFTKDDVQGDPQRLRIGDVDYRFTTNEPNNVVRGLCPIGSTFHFIKRGQQWLPQDRTSNFLISGMDRCSPPR